MPSSVEHPEQQEARRLNGICAECKRFAHNLWLRPDSLTMQLLDYVVCVISAFLAEAVWCVNSASLRPNEVMIAFTAPWLPAPLSGWYFAL
jgi:hypothetical protein